MIYNCIYTVTTSISLFTEFSVRILITSRPCRTVFGYCPPPALGSRKADMKTLSFFFPTPYPCHVARKQLSSPDIMGGRAGCASALHPFLLCPEHDNGWVRWRTLLIPTLQNKGDHQQLQQLAHNNKTFQVRERSRFQSPESGPKHEAGRLARIIIT